jgi:heat shock protein HtpX
LDVPYRVEVQSGVPASAVSGLAEFIATHYLTPNIRFMKGGGFSSGREGDRRYYTWTLDPSLPGWTTPSIGLPAVTVGLSVSSQAVTVEFTGFDPRDARMGPVCDHISDDIEVLVTSFLNHAKTTSLRFLFPVGRSDLKASQPGSMGVRRRVLKRIFAGNTVNMYLILMAVSFVFILFLGDYGIIGILAVQGLALIFSDRLMLSGGSVRVTADHPEVAVVRVMCSPETFKVLSSRGKSLLATVRDAIEHAVASDDLGDPETKARVHGILASAGVACSLDDIDVTKRNPYALVAQAAEKFRLPVPKVTVVNSPTDNAAATGVSPGRASMTITAGALEDLKDDELESVVGHEMGHIKGRDPIILFAATTVMYLGGLYLWLPVLIDLGLFYFIIAFAVIYLVGKFLETRADTESVAVLGGAGLLASALRRIGFTQLYFERYSPRVRFFDWLSFDPHPPIYFRVRRLSRMAEKGEQVRHTLWVSVRDVIAGFFGALADTG